MLDGDGGVLLLGLGAASSEGKATRDIFSFGAADLRVYCIGVNAPLPIAGGEGGGDGRDEAARARLFD